MYYAVKSPDGKNIFPKRPDGKDGRWAVGEVKFYELLKDNEVEFVKNGNKWKVYTKERPLDEEGNLKQEKYETIWVDVALNTNARNEIKELFPELDKTFDTPKPIDLLKLILKMSSSQDDIILDSFAGSGTTAHAVLDLNKEDKSNRKFILIEMEDDVAKDITAERVKRAVTKYKYNDGFEYCELDNSLFNGEGQIDETCTYEQLATYIYFTETKTNINKTNISRPFIGSSPDESAEYYLIFKEKGKNKLSRESLKHIKKSNNKKVIYADQCLLDSDELKRHNILFKQIPYEVERY
jgi:adenine-specific DNA-methyltransferase